MNVKCPENTISPVPQSAGLVRSAALCRERGAPESRSGGGLPGTGKGAGVGRTAGDMHAGLRHHDHRAPQRPRHRHVPPHLLVRTRLRVAELRLTGGRRVGQRGREDGEGAHVEQRAEDEDVSPEDHQPQRVHPDEREGHRLGPVDEMVRQMEPIEVLLACEVAQHGADEVVAEVRQRLRALGPGGRGDRDLRRAVPGDDRGERVDEAAHQDEEHQRDDPREVRCPRIRPSGSERARTGAGAGRGGADSPQERNLKVKPRT